MATASASAKIILFGEHAVVYDQPAIAVPISSLRAYAITSPNDGMSLQIVVPDLNQIFSVDMDSPLSLTARLVLQHLNIPIPNMTIEIHSQIPIASGLGSGAAVSTALARSLSEALDCPLPKDVLNTIVYEVEKLHHGTPSGIDNTVIVYEQPVFFTRNQSIKIVQINQPFRLLIGNTGQSALTRVVIEDVRRLYETEPEKIHPILNEVGMVARQGYLAIESGDIENLGPLMSRNHMLLQKLKVSSPELDKLVGAALKAGAKGAKLSGGGGGGNMIALVDEHKLVAVRKALLDAGASEVFETLIS